MKPSRKVSAGGLAGAIAFIVTWFLGAFTSVEVTPEAASGLTAAIGSITAYFVREKETTP